MNNSVCSTMTLLSALAMALVICHHLPTLPSGGILECGVPWFFFASGFWYGRKPRVWGVEMRKRVVSLLVPYYLWNVIWFPALFIANWIGWKYCGVGRIVDGSAPSIVRCLGLSPWQWPALVPTWFLRALFMVAMVVGGLWALGPIIARRIKCGELVYRVVVSLTFVALMVTKHLWCPVGGKWDGFFVFGVSLCGLACFSLGGVVGHLLADLELGDASPIAIAVRRQLMPVYVLHAIVIVSIGWVAKSVGVFDCLATLPGDIVMWVVGVSGAVAIAEAMRRLMPSASDVLFGGR